MKTLLFMLSSMFVWSSHASVDVRCECSDYWSAGYTLRCEGQTIQFIPDKQAGSHAQAKAACEAAQTNFLKADTRISCKDPHGAPTKAELIFNSQRGNVAVTYPDGQSRDFTVDRTDISNGGTFINNFYTYRFAAYSSLLGPSILILDVNPRFWTDDMSNNSYFQGYGAKVGLGINADLICDLYDFL